jgi:hypothetical protein
MAQINLNLNPGAEMVNLFSSYFDHQESKLHGLIDKMKTANIETKIIGDVMNKLSHAKQSKQGADFSKDETMKRYIVHINKNNPTIFGDFIKGFPEHLGSNEMENISNATLDEHLDHSLREINLNTITIEPLSEEMIDVVIQGLDGMIKMYSADLNEQMMKINDNFDQRSQMIENARQIVKQNGDLNESINRKMSR